MEVGVSFRRCIQGGDWGNTSRESSTCASISFIEVAGESSAISISLGLLFFSSPLSKFTFHFLGELSYRPCHHDDRRERFLLPSPTASLEPRPDEVCVWTTMSDVEVVPDFSFPFLFFFFPLVAEDDDDALRGVRNVLNLAKLSETENDEADDEGANLAEREFSQRELRRRRVGFFFFFFLSFFRSLSLLSFDGTPFGESLDFLMSSGRVRGGGETGNRLGMRRGSGHKLSVESTTKGELKTTGFSSTPVSESSL